MWCIIFHLILTTNIIASALSIDACISGVCKCSTDLKIVNCDAKHWNDLTGIEFPSTVATLTLINNNLRFDKTSDLEKISQLSRLTNLNINENPLGAIPAFNQTNIRFLSMQDASLTSTQIPMSYNGSSLQRILLNDNKFRSINSNDFDALYFTPVRKLEINSAAISSIHPNAFFPLNQLQYLSLKNNLLKSCEFLLHLPQLSSINLDGNQFKSLPQQLTVPKNIKIYSFTNNYITVIDESSPLNFWHKNNYTNMRIYLANNSFECCQSRWFIRFISKSSQFVADVYSLKCAKPPELSGELLIKLNPDQMNCDGDIPFNSWWTPARIIAFSVTFAGIIILIVIGAVFWIINKRSYRSRSGYTQIDEIDNPEVPEFIQNNRDDDRLPRSSFTGSITSEMPSEVQTISTNQGIPAADYSIAGVPAIETPIVVSALV